GGGHIHPYTTKDRVGHGLLRHVERSTSLGGHTGACVAGGLTRPLVSPEQLPGSCVVAVAVAEAVHIWAGNIHRAACIGRNASRVGGVSPGWRPWPCLRLPWPSAGHPR